MAQWGGEMVDRNWGQGLDLERRQCRRVVLQGQEGVKGGSHRG